ncbi:MAG: DUF4442 domain-containing protein [Sphingobacteriales bacterium]|nr:MAG: DUF4442 domain-containing protein [Sphingobacteriales bacterium]
MNKLQLYYRKARTSAFFRWLFNRVLWRTVPFNHPHQLLVTGFEEAALTIAAPYKKANRNHVKGIHACLLATLCEYAVGLSLMLRIDPGKYRLLLKSIRMTYHYQARSKVYIRWGISEEELATIVETLKNKDAILKTFIAKVYDEAGHHICTGEIEWQLKAWNKVATPVE